MTTINDLGPKDKAHWLVHLNALKADNPDYAAAIDLVINGSVAFANIWHPCLIHDWFEGDAVVKTYIESQGEWKPLEDHYQKTSEAKAAIA